jgi:hypothetical protein
MLILNGCLLKEASLHSIQVTDSLVLRGYLGKDVRVVIPSYSVTKIRQCSHSQVYQGFVEANPTRLSVCLYCIAFFLLCVHSTCLYHVNSSSVGVIDTCVTLPWLFCLVWIEMMEFV